MRTVSFALSGEPEGKQRLRLDRRAGRLYTPTPTLKHEERIRKVAREHFPEPFTGAIRLIVEAVFPVRASWSKAKRAALLNQPHLAKPDASNIAKSCEDALNGIAYADDSQVAELVARKLWGETAETRVTVEVLP